MRLALLVAVLAAAPAGAQSADAPAADARAAGARAARAADRAAWAPTARGVRLLGGYASASGLADRYRAASVEPQIGRFVADGLAVSLRAGVSAGRGTFTDTETVDGVTTEREGRAVSYGVTLGPSVTKYFGQAGAAVYPFVGAGAFGVVSRSTQTRAGQPDDESTYRSLAGSARAGLMVPVARNVSIEAQVIGSVYDLSTRARGTVGFSAGIATFLY